MECIYAFLRHLELQSACRTTPQNPQPRSGLELNATCSRITPSSPTPRSPITPIQHHHNSPPTTQEGIQNPQCNKHPNNAHHEPPTKKLQNPTRTFAKPSPTKRKPQPTYPQGKQETNAESENAYLRPNKHAPNENPPNLHPRLIHRPLHSRHQTFRPDPRLPAFLALRPILARPAMASRRVHQFHGGLVRRHAGLSFTGC
ncbi:hypothetical protein AO1008_05556 [Aspergillus oryzae 100-8]|uniref:Uncharacterized protein n=1 Tax=Aspergillus oryzae (strain 3.042) TaxID=1160506 RepID=I8A715_ASPO3|nr:hypothetical protein Ao3042_02720 [Aspergillus oryzae 3.042]KDE79329.1 hypothetical protein AO1008_05556 [Aspergillus oryzae 100-8]|eukprot:EIT80907.1 hypothetical protein Ao3042_02720 [Aspergillus oryzae 3.042]